MSLSLIMAGLVDVLEGTILSGVWAIPVGALVHADDHPDRLRPYAGDSDPRPFELLTPALVESTAAAGDLTSGSYVRVAHEIEVLITYTSSLRGQLVPYSAIADDETLIRHVLEYDLISAQISGCEGITVLRASIEDLIPDQDPGRSPARQLRLVLRIDHREANP